MSQDYETLPMMRSDDGYHVTVELPGPKHEGHVIRRAAWLTFISP